MLVLKVREYAESTNALTEKAVDIVHQIKIRGVLLSSTLKKSLLSLPNSPVSFTNAVFQMKDVVDTKLFLLSF
jgi:hypothetical protein